MAEIEIRTNLPELKSHLNAIGKQFASKVMRGATAAAARVFKKSAQLFAPVLRTPDKRRTPGALQRGIYIKRSKDSTSGREHYFVGFRRGKAAAKKGRDAFYGYFLERGWVPRGPGQRVKGGRRTRALQRTKSAHLQITKYKFIEPAFEKSRSEALDRFFKIADKGIAKINAEKTPK